MRIGLPQQDSCLGSTLSDERNTGDDVARDIIAIGASAGGLSATLDIIRGLPADFPACVLVVLHTSPNSPGVLPSILSRAGALPATYAVDGSAPAPGQIVVARPDHHLMMLGGVLCVRRGPKENGFRPAVDPLFRTLAREVPQRTVGVVLSGARDDGAYGLALLKDRGGLAVVQDPRDALVSGMPQSALNATRVDHVVPAKELAQLLIELTRAPINPKAPLMRDIEGETPGGDPLLDVPKQMDRMQGRLSPLTCPECGGALWEEESGRSLRFRCHVGHGFSPASLLSDGTERLESALWNALRALKEQATLRTKLAERMRKANMAAIAERYESQAEDAESRAELIRSVLLKEPGLAGYHPEEEAEPDTIA